MLGAVVWVMHIERVFVLFDFNGATGHEFYFKSEKTVLTRYYESIFEANII